MPRIGAAHITENAMEGLQAEMIRSELEEVVGTEHISTDETDRLVVDGFVGGEVGQLYRQFPAGTQLPSADRRQQVAAAVMSKGGNHLIQ